MSNQAPYQYLGMPGSTRDCLYVMRLALSQAGYQDPGGTDMLPQGATLITDRQSPDNNRRHAFVLWDWVLKCTVIPSGFRSGYGGEGPHGLALALLMLYARNIPIYELDVDNSLFDRLDENRLSQQDLMFLEQNGKDQYLRLMFSRFVDDVVESHLAGRPANAFQYDNQLLIPWDWLDPELVEHCKSLAPVNMGRALHQAFLVLKSRLVVQYKLPSNIDGDDLVNQLYGSKGLILSSLTDQARQQEVLALRDLLSGMFKVFRNKYGHHDLAISQQEAVTVLWMINELLTILPRHKVRRKRKPAMALTGNPPSAAVLPGTQ